MSILQKVDEAVAFLRTRIPTPPTVAVVLGSGLGGFAESIENPLVIHYSEIPHFPISTVEGHAGSLIMGTLGATQILVMNGRFHYYEGYSMEQVTFPMRVMARLGVATLILSNASGGVNPTFNPGDIMLITDHINLLPNPLIGPNLEEMGTRFPAMNDAYSPRLRELALLVAEQQQIPLVQGCYLATTGPSFETPHEYNFFRVIGADAVGMSTVPEVIVARHCAMEVLAFSVITNVGGLNRTLEVTHREVQAMGQRAGRGLVTILHALFGRNDFLM